MPTITWTCLGCQRRNSLEVDTLKNDDLNGGGWEEPEREDLCHSCYYAFEARFPRSRKFHPDETLAGFLLSWLWLTGGLNFDGEPSDHTEHDHYSPEDREQATKLLIKFGRPIVFPIIDQGFGIFVEELSVATFVVASLGPDGHAMIEGTDQTAAYKQGDSVNALAYFPDGSQVPGKLECFSAEEFFDTREWSRCLKRISANRSMIRSAGRTTVR